MSLPSSQAPLLREIPRQVRGHVDKPGALGYQFTLCRLSGWLSNHSRTKEGQGRLNHLCRLLVAGDVGERFADIEWTLEVLSERFATVVWAPGNHELWTHP